MMKTSHRRTFSTRCLCVALSIVTAVTVESTRADDGVGLSTIAKWDFGTEEDVQADRWPDGWTRLKDSKHPGFIPIQIDRKSVMGADSIEADQTRRLLAKLYLGWQTQQSPWEIIPETIPAPVEKFVEQTLVDPYLRVDMDGSSAEVYSPKIPVDDASLYGLQLDARCDTEDFAAKGRLRFFDRSGKLIFQTETANVPGDASWQTLRTQGTYDAPDGIAAIQAALIIEPRTAKATHAVIGFDRIRIVQMPKIRLMLDRTSQLYRPKETVNVQLFASGLRKGTTRVELILYDHEGVAVANESRELNHAQNVLTSTSSNPFASRWEGYCDWKLNNLQPGYYEIVTQLKRSNAVFFQNRENFAVVPLPQNSALDPRFGWSLDNRVLGWSLDQLISLIREGGTGCIKIPIWFDANAPLQQDKMCETVDRIQALGIRCVGIIQPLAAQTNGDKTQDSELAQGTALEDPNMWQPQLEPVFRAMCMRLVDFQVGTDQDTQYGSNPRYEEMLSWIKRILRRYGTEPTMTLAKNPWLHFSNTTSVDRWQWSIDETIAESEWSQAIIDPNSRYPDWTCITPISANVYSLSTRTKDLAARMVASIRPVNGKMSTAWISEPFADDVGFLGTNGSPREMFLPYRTILEAIKRKEYIGEMSMDGGSRNALLASDSDSCLVVWSSSPVTEQFFLGEQVDAIDSWGRKVDIEKTDTQFGPEHRIQLDKWPVIIRGVDAKIAMWRMGVTMDQQRLDSLIGLPQQLNVRFNNPFSFPVSGRIDLVAPGVFANDMESATFDVGASSEVSVPIDVLVRPDATSQDSPVRIVVSLNTSPPKRFSISKTLRIGNDDVEFETAYRISDSDELWLDIDAINHTDKPTSFDCQLFIPERRNERIQIASVETRKTRTVVLPKANELVYKTLWLRCVQLGTRRILNYRIAIEPEAADSSTDGGGKIP
jgi:hypothetical protein